MAKLQQVHVVQEFNFPVETLFALLSEHENLSKIFFPAKVTRIKDGNTSRNGAGSARRMQMPLAPSFVETTLVYKENEQIEYAITDGFAPITNHYGVMKFIDLGNNRSKLDYTIEFKGLLPGVGPAVKALLQNGIPRGLKKLKP